MAVREFTRNALIAGSALNAGRQAGAGPDAAVDRWIASRSLWLTPDTVRGFDPDDFPLLTPDQRRDLQARVDRFRATAAELGGRTPTPPEVVEAARLFTEVYEPLSAYWAKPEGEAVMRALWAGPVPAFVLGVEYDLDTDWAGEPAVYIWVIVRDDTDPESDEFVAFSRGFNGRVWDALPAAGSDRIPHVAYRLESEAKAALAGGAA